MNGMRKPTLYFSCLIGAVIVVVTALWRGNGERWFDLPFRILGFRGFNVAIPILVMASFAGLPFILIRIWQSSPRPISIILFLVTLAIGFFLFIWDRPNVTELYKHAQPVVVVMILLAISTVLEVYFRGLEKGHLLTAMTTVLIAVTYWFVILLVTASA